MKIHIKTKNHCFPVLCSLYYCKLLAEYKENIVEELYIHKNFILFLQEKMAHLFPLCFTIPPETKNLQRHTLIYIATASHFPLGIKV